VVVTSNSRSEALAGTPAATESPEPLYNCPLPRVVYGI